MPISLMRALSRPRLRCWFALVACVWLSGCQRQDDIQAYSAPKDAAPSVPSSIAGPSDRAGELASGRPAVAAPAAAPSQPQRMLAAIVPEGAQNAWFFKMTGDASKVTPQLAAFKSLIGSVRFENGQPQFQLPEGWQRQAARGMRFATLTCGPPDAPLETSVIRLGVQEPNWDTYVLGNVNRWRNQLGLAPVTPTELPNAVKQLSAGELQVTFLDIEGAGSTAGTEMRFPPLAQPSGTSGKTQDRAGPPDADRPAAAESQVASGFTSDPPSHWTPGRSGGMRKAAFQLQQDDANAECTVITLGPSGGEMLPNVNRWRNQVGLEPLNEEQTDQFVETLTIGGEQGWFVRCRDEGQPQAILAAVVIQGGQSWFFKMMGDRQLVDDETENFETFLKSVQFGNK